MMSSTSLTPLDLPPTNRILEMEVGDREATLVVECPDHVTRRVTLALDPSAGVPGTQLAADTRVVGSICEVTPTDVRFKILRGGGVPVPVDARTVQRLLDSGVRTTLRVQQAH